MEFSGVASELGFGEVCQNGSLILNEHVSGSIWTLKKDLHSLKLT